MPNIADFKDASGQVNWPAYHAASQRERQAEIDSGQWCYQCGAYIIFSSRTAGRTRCSQCNRLDQPEEVRHDKFVRCPKCARAFDPSQADYYQLYREGEHTVHCPDCSERFEIETHVSYTFTSPARISEPSASTIQQPPSKRGRAPKS